MQMHILAATAAPLELYNPPCELRNPPFITVSILKPLRNSRFNYETTVRRLQKFNGHLDPRSGLKYPLEIPDSSK
jgi:hypothetical protein